MSTAVCVSIPSSRPCRLADQRATPWLGLAAWHSIPLITFGDSTPTPLSLSFGCNILRSQQTRWASVHTLSNDNIPQHIWRHSSRLRQYLGLLRYGTHPARVRPSAGLPAGHLQFTVCALEPCGPNLNASAPVSSLPQAELPKCLTAEGHKNVRHS